MKDVQCSQLGKLARKTHDTTVSPAPPVTQCFLCAVYLLLIRHQWAYSDVTSWPCKRPVWTHKHLSFSSCSLCQRPWCNIELKSGNTSHGGFNMRCHGVLKHLAKCSLTESRSAKKTSASGSTPPSYHSGVNRHILTLSPPTEGCVSHLFAKWSQWG